MEISVVKVTQEKIEFMKKILDSWGYWGGSASSLGFFRRERERNPQK